MFVRVEGNGVFRRVYEAERPAGDEEKGCFDTDCSGATDGTSYEDHHVECITKLPSLSYLLGGI